jgi:hypothetical protein
MTVLQRNRDATSKMSSIQSLAASSARAELSKIGMLREKFTLGRKRKKRAQKESAGWVGRKIAGRI